MNSKSKPKRCDRRYESWQDTPLHCGLVSGHLGPCDATRIDPAFWASNIAVPAQITSDKIMRGNSGDTKDVLHQERLGDEALKRAQQVYADTKGCEFLSFSGRDVGRGRKLLVGAGKVVRLTLLNEYGSAYPTPLCGWTASDECVLTDFECFTTDKLVVAIRRPNGGIVSRVENPLPYAEPAKGISCGTPLKRTFRPPRCVTCGLGATEKWTKGSWDVTGWMLVVFGGTDIDEDGHICPRCAPKAWLLIREMTPPPQGHTNKGTR